MFRRAIRSALFVDFHNMAPKFVGGGFAEALPAWLAWFEDGAFDPKKKKRKFEIKRAYLTKPFKQYAGNFEAGGFDVIPTASDMVIVLDALESVYLNKRIDEYIILTVDVDFDQLLERLGERDKDRVVTIEPGTPCATAFPPRAEITIALEDFRAALQYRRQLTPWMRAAQAVQAPWKRVFNYGGSALSRIGERNKDRKRRSSDAKFIKIAAYHIATLAQSRPGSRLGRRTIMRHLESVMPEFKSSRLYFGLPSYREMLAKFVEIRPDLELYLEPNGGVAVIAPRRDDKE